MSEALSLIPAELAANPALFVGLCVFLGLMVGSFLNVVIHRVPIMMDNLLRAECAELEGREAPVQPTFNLVVPRSACPKCQAPITALQNIPVVSWLALRGQCANCKAPISKRYPLVELTTGILTGVVAAHFGYGLLAVGGILFTWFVIALALIDFDTQLLPDQLTYPLLWLGLLMSLSHPVWAPGASPVTPVDSILGAAVGYLSLWSLFWIYWFIRKEEGMGFGDFKLFAAFGAWFGWKMLLPILLFASLVGSICGVYLLYRRRKGLETKIVFGPFLAAAGWLFLLVGHQTVDRYLGMFPHAR
jgi:leader peptidase (prepilin peptidase) / N-methyltransferase